MRLSYSALDTFKQCPQKYKFQYVDRIPAPKSKDAIFGTLVHSALKYYHEPNRLAPLTEEELLNFWLQNWDASVFDDQRLEATLFAQGVQILKNYFAKNSGLDFDVLALETPFEAPVTFGQDAHFVTGKIDRIDKLNDGGFEVIDYKTTKKMPAQKSVDEDLQLAIYHIGVANRWPSLVQENRPIKTSLYFLKHGEKLSTTKTNVSLENTQETIARLFEKIKTAHEQQKFDPLPNPLCDWCAYQKICPVWKHKFREEKIFFNDQDVAALINQHLTLKSEIDDKKQKLAKIQNTLSKFMDQENMERLFSPDGYISRQLIQRFKYDPLLVRNILEPVGRWTEVLKLDETKLKKAVKEMPPDLRQKIDEAKKLDKEYKTYSVVRNKKRSAT